MDKETFMLNWCPQYEEWDCAYETVKDYLDAIDDISAYDIYDPGDITTVIEEGISNQIFGTLCRDLCGENFYEEHLEVFDNVMDMNFIKIGYNNCAEVSLTAIEGILIDEFTTNDIEIPEFNTNILSIEHNLNSEFSIKFVVYE